MLNNILDDATLAEVGARRVKWYRKRMKVLSKFKEKYIREKTFLGKSILVCMHCEPKGVIRTEVLLASGVSEIVFIGNAGSTKSDAAAYLASLPNVTVMAKEDDTLEDIDNYIKSVIDTRFDLIMDNGGSILNIYNETNTKWVPIGGIEETRSGQLLLEAKGINPQFPLLVIDNSDVKRLIENEAGVGQSTIDGLMNATSLLLGGKKVLIIGYGYCGKGISQRLRAIGALTMVHDIDQLKILKARIEGHTIGKLEDLLLEADIIVTATGAYNIINNSHIQYIKDETIICNSGNYNLEINRKSLYKEALCTKRINNEIEEILFDNKSIYILQNANPINLSSGSGNPIEIMDLGYALQLLSLEDLVRDSSKQKTIQPLSKEINDMACKLCIETWWG
jgi:adenosylhomocysteinase